MDGLDQGRAGNIPVTAVAEGVRATPRLLPTQRTNRTVVILIVASSLLMQNLDSTVLGTALTTIAADFGTDPVRLHMAMTGYLLSLAVFMPLSGWVADRFGTRNVFCAAVAIFTLASIACAFAPSLPWLVSGRVVQGIGGAMMLPVARLALLRAVPKHELIGAMAWVSLPALAGPVLGPPVGGFIVTYWDWSWIFWINVPVGVLGIVLAIVFMDDAREEHVPPLDLTGFLLIGFGFSGLILGFETIGEGLLPRWVNLLAVLVAAAAIAAYVGHARRAAAPVLDLSLLRIPTFFASVVGGGVVRIGIGALPFLLPLMLQVGFGYSPLDSGLITLAAALGAIAMKLGAESLIRRYGFRRTLIWNTLLSAVSLIVLMLFTPATPAWVIFVVLLVGGFFRSLTFTALNTLVFADIEQRRMSQAAGFSAVVQQLSLAMGVGLGAMLLNLARAGQEPRPEDFLAPFAVIGLIVAISAVQFTRLSPDAGNAVSQGRPIAPGPDRGV
jgi:EmrB/QacA subfamily drug resistance transporter